MWSLFEGFFVLREGFIVSWRQRFQRVFGFLLDFLYQNRVSPDFLSVLSMFMVFVSTVFLYWQNNFFLLFLFFGIFLDMLDGSLAERYGVSSFGVMFDYLCDRFSDVMLIFALYASDVLDFYESILFLFVFAVASILAKYFEHNNAKVSSPSIRVTLFVAWILAFLDSRILTLGVLVLAVYYIMLSLVLLPEIARVKKPG